MICIVPNSNRLVNSGLDSRQLWNEMKELVEDASSGTWKLMQKPKGEYCNLVDLKSREMSFWDSSTLLKNIFLMRCLD